MVRILLMKRLNVILKLLKNLSKEFKLFNKKYEK